MAVEQSQGAVELVLDTLNSELMSYINKVKRTSRLRLQEST